MSTNPSNRSRGTQQQHVQQQQSTSNSSQRNLLSSTLSRRQPAVNPPATSSTTATAQNSSAEEDQASEDIIVRDEHGNCRLDLPLMTPLPRDEAREEREVENRLIETYIKHQQHVEPNELKTMLQASLQAKVASLEEDKWMFEKDDSPVQ